MNEQQSQTLLLKVDLLFTIYNNKLTTEGERSRLETSAKLRVFVSNVSSPSLQRQYTRYNIPVFVSRIKESEEIGYI